MHCMYTRHSSECCNISNATAYGNDAHVKAGNTDRDSHAAGIQQASEASIASSDRVSRCDDPSCPWPVGSRHRWPRLRHVSTASDGTVTLLAIALQELNQPASRGSKSLRSCCIVLFGLLSDKQATQATSPSILRPSHIVRGFSVVSAQLWGTR